MEEGLEKLLSNMNSVEVHKSFFDRAKNAYEMGYHLEAVFLKYAAIEGRLEVLCGLFSCPCNKFLPDSLRKDIGITQRAKCLRTIYKKHPACVNPRCKLNKEFWDSLGKWIRERNTYVHGLYKRTDEYVTRNAATHDLSKRGLEISKLLYSEVKRIRRLEKNHTKEMRFEESLCKGKCTFLQTPDYTKWNVEHGCD